MAAPSSTNDRVTTGSTTGDSEGPVRGYGSPPIPADPLFAQINTKPATGDPNIDGLLYGITNPGGTVAVYWNAASLQFSFPSMGSFYGTNYADDENITGFEAFTGDQKQVVRAILDYVGEITNMDFSEIVETASTHASLRYAESSVPEIAYAYLPGSENMFPEGGDVWFSNDDSFDSPVLGTYEWTTFLHETGHALGLKHGHEDETGLGGFDAMNANRDSMEFSVMTYRSYVGHDAMGYTNGFSSYAQTFMMYDIAALQHLYGADFTFNDSDSVYTFSLTTGEMFINGVGQGAPSANKIFRTVWDGGGEDTYDYSNYSISVTIDLTPGGWSAIEDESQIDPNSSQRATLGFPGASVIFARGNVFNALQFQGDLRSLIENAIGGTGDDTIVGNQAANKLTGGSGADVISGLDGADELIGGNGGDTLDGGDGADFLQGNAGNDTLDGGEAADRLEGGSGNDTLIAGGGVDLVRGGGGDDTITGGDGDDTLRGLADNDTIVGEAGDDRLEGAAGVDDLDGGDGDDVIIGGDGADTLRGGANNDEMNGSAGDDDIQGGGGDDTLNGNAGIDIIVGGGGADLIFGGGQDDLLQGGSENDELRGGGDNDRLEGGGGDDMLYGITGDDELVGAGGADSLFGGGGADDLDGGAGNDILRGADGNDVMHGRSGADIQFGGAGADVFDFNDVSESGTSNGARDEIRDFSRGEGDKIDLAGVDANANLGGDQAFTVVGAFTGTAGELTLTAVGGGVVRVAADVDGDGSADMEIDVSGQADLGAGDFIL